jgi:hypothetical protein
VEFTLLDADTGIVTGWSSITVIAAQAESDPTEESFETPTEEATSESTEEPTSEATEEATSEATAEATVASGDGSGGAGGSSSATEPEAVQTPAAASASGAPLSDGTGGPQLPRGGDGTGGIRQIAIP